MTQPNPSRRTVVRTAAWAVPAVTLVTAAPAFAASANYTDLSTTVAPPGVGRVADAPNKVEVPATTFVNSGDLPVEGILVSVTASLPIVTIEVMGYDVGDLAGLGIIAGGLGTTAVTLAVPADFMTIPPGESLELPVSQTFVFGGPEEVTMQMVVTGVNATATENVPFVSPSMTIPAAA